MKKIIGIIVCLWSVVSVFAVDYHPIKATGNRPAGSYYATHSQPSSAFRSTSVYNSRGLNGYGASFSAISTSNFNALNSEGGACYLPTATSGPRKGVVRPGSDSDDDDEENLAIGEIIYRSPLGDAPVGLILLLCGIWIISRAKNLSGKLQKK